ncbi:MAG: cytoplasmic protein [Rhodocyclaceae bacterium]|nr:cytoplasmic protein [Rhodocyclaceae bacterium]
MIDQAKVRREAMRWYLLLALYNGSPEQVCEELLLSTMQGIFPDATALEVRRELDYLEARSLVLLRKEPAGRWWADLTRHGTDMSEYTIDCQPGIARPVKTWG